MPHGLVGYHLIMFWVKLDLHGSSTVELYKESDKSIGEYKEFVFPSSLSGLTPIISNMELTHLGWEASRFF